MVNLTTLAPDIMVAILDDALPNQMTLFDLAVAPPALWDEQRAAGYHRLDARRNRRIFRCSPSSAFRVFSCNIIAPSAIPIDRLSSTLLKAWPTDWA
jgi:hypothetical protein